MDSIWILEHGFYMDFIWILDHGFYMDLKSMDSIWIVQFYRVHVIELMKTYVDSMVVDI